MVVSLKKSLQQKKRRFRWCSFPPALYFLFISLVDWMLYNIATVVVWQRQQTRRKVVENVRTGVLQSQPFLKAAVRQHPDILCIVYTINLPKSRQALPPAVDAWASKFDDFFAV
jgi:hypothetical protein